MIPIESQLHPKAGSTQGKLTFTGVRKNEKVNGHSKWLYEVRCVCGRSYFIQRSSYCRSVQSCLSCITRPITQPLRKTRLYRIWTGIKTRCFNKRHEDYRNYGKRGISICNEWYDFKVFSSWAFQAGYKDTLTIDRIDSTKDYEPTNCRWIPSNENRKSLKAIYTYPHGESFASAKEAAKIFNLSKTYIGQLCNGNRSFSGRWFYYKLNVNKLK